VRNEKKKAKPIPGKSELLGAGGDIGVGFVGGSANTR
jgi:hypothetical protein